MFDVISLGDTTIDIFNILDDPEIDVISSMNHDVRQLCLTYADKIPVREVHRLVAGNTTNNAVGASRLGLRTAIYTIVGDDSSGADIREKLEEEGVATDYVMTSRGTKTNLHTVLAFRGERTILVHHVRRQYRLPALVPSKWLYLTSMAEGSEMVFPDIFEYLTAHRTKLAYQPGTFQLRLGLARSKSLLRETALIIMNREEAIRFLGVPDTTLPKELVMRFLDHGPDLAVVTDGTNGSYAGHHSGVWFLGTDPTIPRIESTGAGDAFATGFLTATILGHSLPEAMRWGTFDAEGVIQQIGPQAGLLTREKMEFVASQRIHFQPKRI